MLYADLLIVVSSTLIQSLKYILSGCSILYCDQHCSLSILISFVDVNLRFRYDIADYVGFGRVSMQQIFHQQSCAVPSHI